MEWRVTTISSQNRLLLKRKQSPNLPVAVAHCRVRLPVHNRLCPRQSLDQSAIMVWLVVIVQTSETERGLISRKIKNNPSDSYQVWLISSITAFKAFFFLLKLSACYFFLFIMVFMRCNNRKNRIDKRKDNQQMKVRAIVLSTFGFVFCYFLLSCF